MHFLYIIFSPSKNKYYVGETKNLEKRLLKHNNHTYKNAFTNIASDWEFVIKKTLNNKEEALYLERFIKRMKSKKFILKIIENISILDNLLENKN